MDEINNIEVVPCTESDYLKPFRVHYNQLLAGSGWAVQGVPTKAFQLHIFPKNRNLPINGTKKSWDFMRTHDSVSVLIFNTTSHCFVLVKQFRPAVYMCEWERTKTQPCQPAEKTEEGSSEAVASGSERREDRADAEGGSSSAWPPAATGITYELCAGLVDKPDLSLEEIARQEVLEECGYDVPASKLKRITSYRSGVGVTGSKQTMFYAEVSDDNCVSAGGGEPREGELIEVVKVPLHEAMTFAYNERIPKTMGVIFSFIWFHNNMSPKYKISTNV